MTNIILSSCINMILCHLVTVELVISQDLHVSGFFPQSSEGIFHGAVSQVAFELDEEAVFPASVLDGAAFNFGHVDIVVNKMAEHVVQGTAFVRQFETDVDLACVLAEYFLVRDDDESGGIGSGHIHTFFQDFQAVYLCCIFAGDGCLGLVLVLFYLFCRKSIVLHTDLLPGMFG